MSLQCLAERSNYNCCCTIMDNEPSSSLGLTTNKDPLIGIVGPCGSGKSTLVAGLEQQGVRCRHIAQEHSYLKHMLQGITKAGMLIFLPCSFGHSTTRRKLNWLLSDYEG